MEGGREGGREGRGGGGGQKEVISYLGGSEHFGALVYISLPLLMVIHNVLFLSNPLTYWS